MIAKLLAFLPTLEVSARLAYWRVPVLRRLGDRIRVARAASTKRGPVADAAPIAFDDVETALRTLGVGPGDMLIVHSAFSALKPTGLSPDEVIARLKALVGDAGTLAMPAIPIIRHEPQGDDKFRDAAYARTFTYDARSTRIATGALPRALMGMAGAARSRHPGNAMVAIGPEAAAMMEGNLNPTPGGRGATPCGPTSSWAYGYRRGAKVVALGVDLVHSLTMIHVAEDAFEADWPIAADDWYRDRAFQIRDGDFTTDTVIRERRHGWSQFYAERAFSADLHRAGIVRTLHVGALTVSACAADAMVDALRRHPRKGYPYVFPFGFRSSGSR